MSLPRRFSALRKVLDITPVHVVITNPDGRIIYANAAAENHTGFLIVEMIGRKPGELWGGKMPKELYATMWKIISQDRRAFVENMRNSRKNGEPYWQEVHILPVLNVQQQIECFLGIEFDHDDSTEKAVFARLIRSQELKALNVECPEEWGR